MCFAVCTCNLLVRIVLEHLYGKPEVPGRLCPTFSCRWLLANALLIWEYKSSAPFSQEGQTLMCNLYFSVSQENRLDLRLHPKCHLCLVSFLSLLYHTKPYCCLRQKENCVSICILVKILSHVFNQVKFNISFTIKMTIYKVLCCSISLHLIVIYHKPTWQVGRKPWDYRKWLLLFHNNRVIKQTKNSLSLFFKLAFCSEWLFYINFDLCIIWH